MENAPIENHENSDKKKRRKSFELGTFAVDIKEPKREVPPEPPKAEKQEASWFKDSQAETEVSSVIDASKNTPPPFEVIESSDEDDEEEEEESSTVETVSEAEAPADGTLSQEEVRAVVSASAEHEAKNIPEYDPAAEKTEALGDLGTAVFLEEAAESGDIEDAAQKAAEVLGIELPEDTEELPVEAEELEIEPTDEEATEPEGPSEELVFDRSSEHESIATEDDEDEPEASAAGGGTTAGSGGTGTAAGGPTAAGSGTAAGAGGAGGGGTPPTAGGYYGPGGPFGAAFGGAPGGPGRSPATAPNAAPRTPDRDPNHDYIDDRASPAAMAIAGGIIGYLIGRRRGRIKTEKRLLPVQKKLEKQVEDLQWQIKAKESKIRKAAAEKVRLEGPAVVEAVAAKQAARAAEKPKAERLSAETQDGRVEERLNQEPRRRAPEAHQLHGAKAPELIGQMLMSAESIPAAGAIVETKAVANTEAPRMPKLERREMIASGKPVTEQSVETLNRAELLQLSEQIVVEGSSLRQIYETRLVGERGLRRLIAEHLRGGDLKKALRREIVEREIDFERDPVMRDMSPAGPSGGNSTTPVGGGQTALNQLVEKAAASLPAASEQAAFYKARAAYEVDQSNRQKKRQQIMDVSLTAIIILLLGMVIFFAITRG